MIFDTNLIGYRWIQKCFLFNYVRYQSLINAQLIPYHNRPNYFSKSIWYKGLHHGFLHSLWECIIFPCNICNMFSGFDRVILIIFFLVIWILTNIFFTFNKGFSISTFLIKGYEKILSITDYNWKTVKYCFIFSFYLSVFLIELSLLLMLSILSCIPWSF